MCLYLVVFLVDKLANWPNIDLICYKFVTHPMKFTAWILLLSFFSMLKVMNAFRRKWQPLKLHQGNNILTWKKIVFKCSERDEGGITVTATATFTDVSAKGNAVAAITKLRGEVIEAVQNAVTNDELGTDEENKIPLIAGTMPGLVGKDMLL